MSGIYKTILVYIFLCHPIFMGLDGTIDDPDWVKKHVCLKVGDSPAVCQFRKNTMEHDNPLEHDDI